MLRNSVAYITLHSEEHVIALGNKAVDYKSRAAIHLDLNAITGKSFGLLGIKNACHRHSGSVHVNVDHILRPAIYELKRCALRAELRDRCGIGLVLGSLINAYISVCVNKRERKHGGAVIVYKGNAIFYSLVRISRFYNRFKQGCAYNGTSLIYGELYDTVGINDKRSVFDLDASGYDSILGNGVEIVFFLTDIRLRHKLIGDNVSFRLKVIKGYFRGLVIGSKIVYNQITVGTVLCH